MEILNPLVEKAIESMQSIGKDSEEYKTRLEIEVKEVEKQGMWDYFNSLVEKGKRFKNENNLLFAFLLGICDEDPLENGEELQWLESNDFPDIDTDFLPDDRDVVKKWISERFGEDRVCSICNYSTYQTKSALVDVSRVFEIPVNEIRSITTKMDNDVNKMGIKDACETYPQLKKFMEDDSDRIIWYGTKAEKDAGGTPKRAIICDIVERLRGRHYRLGKHAAGVIIADRPLTDIVPLVQRDGKVMSAWAEGQASSDLKTVGLIKFDILGLENLEYIKTAKELIQDVWRKITFEDGTSRQIEKFKRYGKDRCIDDLVPGLEFPDNGEVKIIKSIEPVVIDFESSEDYLNDEECLKQARNGDLIGVFQFDSKGIREIAKAINITEFEDMVSATCLFRPGPLDSGMAEDFIKRRGEKLKGEQSYKLHPILEPIIGKTEGIGLYQEQTMQIFNKVGGISLPNCEKIRKAMGQKKKEVFLKFKDEFIKTGSRKLGWPATLKEANSLRKKGEEVESVEEFWDKIEKSAGYLFNRSHGVVYTVVSMQCLYLKTHYPREYFAAVLSRLKPGDERRALYMMEASRLKVKFVPVHINKSKVGFSINEDGKVYFGLDKIKGIGAQADKILEGQPYDSFEDFINKFGIGKKVCEPLIKLGAFDDFEPNRKALYEAWETHYKQKNRKKKKEVDVNQDTEPFTLSEICKFEDLYYGLFFNHPLSTCRRVGYTIEKVIENKMDKAEVYISDIKQKKTKKGNPYYQLFTEDDTGSLRLTIWEDQYESNKELLVPGECIFIEVVPPSKFPTANMKKKGLVSRLPRLDEPDPEIALKAERDRSFQAIMESVTAGL